jgi:hypothetical protein
MFRRPWTVLVGGSGSRQRALAERHFAALSTSIPTGFGHPTNSVRDRGLALLLLGSRVPLSRASPGPRVPFESKEWFFWGPRSGVTLGNRNQREVVS